jgi:NAD kinase
MTENKIILVVRRTRLDDLIARFNTLAQAQFYVEHLGADFSDYQKEHENYKKAVMTAEAQLHRLGRVQVLDRDFLPNFIFAEQDTVVVLGQDGLVANTVKYLNGQMIIGVNPDPQRWDGILLPFQVTDLRKVVPEVFAQHRPIQEVTMAKASLNDGQILYAVNDLFIGRKSHTSALYQIQIGQQQEQQSSSGIIVSTGLGSTAWFKSLVIGATAITQALLKEGKLVALDSFSGRINQEQMIDSSYPWDTNYLHFTVREPFPSNSNSVTKLIFGKITAEQSMLLVSQMPENGVIFSDGIENDFLEFNAGTQAVISIAEKRGYLVV